MAEQTPAQVGHSSLTLPAGEKAAGRSDLEGDRGRQANRGGAESSTEQKHRDGWGPQGALGFGQKQDPSDEAQGWHFFKASR